MKLEDLQNGYYILINKCHIKPPKEINEKELLGCPFVLVAVKGGDDISHHSDTQLVAQKRFNKK